MKNRICIIFFCFCFVRCSHDIKMPTSDRISNGVAIVLEAYIKNNYKNYDICDKFNEFFSDSSININLVRFNQIFTKDDVEYMLKQYLFSKGKKIVNYVIDSTFYKYKPGSTYFESDSIFYHFSLSPPLFSLDNKHWVIYIAIYELKYPYTMNCFEIIFESFSKDSVKVLDIIQNQHIKLNNIEHFHDGSFFPDIKLKNRMLLTILLHR